MPKESFLFVAYHAGQHNLADAKLVNSDARSHAAAVSRQRRDNKRRKTQLAVQEFTTDLTINTHNKVVPEPETSNQDVDHDEFTSADESSPRSTGKSRGQRRQQMRAMQFSWRAGNATAELKLSGGLRVDPFAVVPSDNFSQVATDYFMQVISTVNQPIYAIFNVTNIYTSYWLELMTKQDYRPMGVAMVGAVMQRLRDPQAQPSEEVKMNHALAVSRMKKKCTTATELGQTVADDVSIITVLGFANLARFHGDSKAYNKHRQRMKLMVSERGGLEALGHGGLVAAAVSQWDSFWAIEKGGEPLFTHARQEHIPVYPAFPLSCDLRNVFVRLPVGFQSLILMGKVSVELVDVLGRMSEALENGIQALAPGNMWHSEIRKHRDFLEACPALATPDAARNIVEKEITLALFLYCANTFTTARSSTSLFYASRIELSRLLLQTDELQYSNPERECLFWTCAVCIDSWRQSGPDTPLLEGGHNLEEVFRRMRNGFDVNNILQRFFCNQVLLDSCKHYLEDET